MLEGKQARGRTMAERLTPAVPKLPAPWWGEGSKDDEPLGLWRPKQTDCRQEPDYFLSNTVLFSIRSPDITAHMPTHRCARLEPHPMSECGEWRNE